ncbi:RNA polymerase sigma factor [Nisaea acidiphila]|uniref:RNA polymerase sigma factor n=1 Tax=Nisaea acidiphila TaxID=1862145 RepID=A0A9J7AXE5_9PROT|nr:RNA polymerase sigma factor [Nisaea acidiphila]UUX51105.1 RNA polymerase sigma factor [Nisaea acidiphila]
MRQDEREFADWTALATQAQSGDREALEALIRSSQDQIYGLALRFLANQDDARDATQDILILLITRLSNFEGRSSFRTWAFRIAVNHLLRSRKVRARSQSLSFAAFEEDLHTGLSDQAGPGADHTAMIGELRIACTMAMLLCLDVEQRMAFVLGEILELDHREAANILAIEPATYRKRLSRARSAVIGFSGRVCGNVSESARCSCDRRVPEALRLGRIHPSAPLTRSAGDAGLGAILEQTRGMERNLKALCQMKSPARFTAPDDLADIVRSAVDAPHTH